MTLAIIGNTPGRLSIDLASFANPDCIQRKVLITPTGVDKN